MSASMPIIPASAAFAPIRSVIRHTDGTIVSRGQQLLYVGVFTERI